MSDINTHIEALEALRQQALRNYAESIKDLESQSGILVEKVVLRLLRKPCATLSAGAKR